MALPVSGAQVPVHAAFVSLWRNYGHGVSLTEQLLRHYSLPGFKQSGRRAPRAMRRVPDEGVFPARIRAWRYRLPVGIGLTGPWEVGNENDHI
jgi:hypothetical protein